MGQDRQTSFQRSCCPYPSEFRHQIGEDDLGFADAVKGRIETELRVLSLRCRSRDLLSHKKTPCLDLADDPPLRDRNVVPSSGQRGGRVSPATRRTTCYRYASRR